MQGIYVNGVRPKSKKAVRDAVTASHRVRLEGTSLHGGDYDGDITRAPAGTYNFVGPDPYRDRRFYGTIVVKADGSVKVS